MCEIDLHATVEKLYVKSGECLVVTFTDPRGTPDNIEMIRAILKECLPKGVKFFFKDEHGIRLSVVKDTEPEPMASKHSEEFRNKRAGELSGSQED